MYVQGGSEFSEGATAKWIFDVEIEELGAEVLFTRGEDKNHAWLSPVSTNREFKSNVLQLHFHFFRIDFS
jgi:hypothetical protein